MAELTATQRPNLPARLLGQFVDALRSEAAQPEFLPFQPMTALMPVGSLERLSYGDPLFRMPQQSNIPITVDNEYLIDALGLAAGLPGASRGATKLTNEAADQLVRAITRNEQATAPAVLEAAGQMLPMSRVISRDVATQIKMPVTLPQSDEFVNAVQNTPGAEITNEGLVMRLQRMQKPEQAGEESVRTGVFYLPEGSAGMKYYKSGGGSYGGSQPISGETLYKNPLFVKGATGGKAPEKAYDLILGKGAYEQMRKDALKVRHPELISDRRYGLSDAITPEQFLAKYAPDLEGYGDYIFRSSRQGNQLAYALQEAAVAQKVRDAGYDAVLGFSQKKTGDKFISEVFDVREATYPTPEGEFTLRPEFAGLLDEPAQSVAEAPIQRAFTTVNPGDEVSGLTVREDVPNMSSIGATIENYEILQGIRKVPRKAFDEQYLNSLNPAKLDKRTADLSDEIKQSKEINPLIVAVDDQGAYIIEGGHRFDALMTQKRESVPAVVVIDKDNPPTEQFLQSLLD